MGKEREQWFDIVAVPLCDATGRVTHIAKLVQDVYSNFGTDRRFTLQISVDVLNLGNMINDSWGNYVYNPIASYDNVRPLRVNNKGTSTAAPIYTLNASSLDDFAKKTTLSKDVSTSSTWGCLLGIRLIF